MKPQNRKVLFAHMQAMNQKRDLRGRFMKKYNRITLRDAHWTVGGTENWFESLWDYDRETYMKCIEALEKIRREQ